MPVKATSSYRDRTQEFGSVAQKLRKSSSLTPASDAPVTTSSSGGAARGDGAICNSFSSAQPLPPRSAAPAESEFNKKASRISLGIHQTSQKLNKLAKLAKKKAVFDDPALEIQELTALIKQDITVLNSAIADLQMLPDFQDGGNSSSDSSAHLVTVVDNLKSSLMNATKEFKEVLTMRNENLKVQENRRQLFSASTESSNNPFIRQRPLATRTAATASAAMSPPPWASEPSTSSDLLQGNKAEGESHPLLQQRQQQQLVRTQDSYIQSRAGALQNVESTIHELGSIFTQLATMVTQQGELAIRIDENMEDTLANVEGAQGQLMKYLTSISSNRWLMIKLFFIIIFFLMIYLFFVA